MIRNCLHVSQIEMFPVECTEQCVHMQSQVLSKNQLVVRPSSWFFKTYDQSKSKQSKLGCSDFYPYFLPQLRYRSISYRQPLSTPVHIKWDQAATKRKREGYDLKNRILCKSDRILYISNKNTVHIKWDQAATKRKRDLKNRILCKSYNVHIK